MSDVQRVLPMATARHIQGNWQHAVVDERCFAARSLNALDHTRQAHHPALDFAIWIAFGEPLSGHTWEGLRR